tara:strand:+ start:3176 stop:3796 length:621 start_codon:yes stop_codon:yes gene_type:complete
MEIIYFIMAISLNNSLFIHFPKTGGKWITNMLMNYVDGAKPVGDPIYDAHKSPPFDGKVFFFVREPESWVHSLWHHRARKKNNKFGHKFNWQENHRLERDCKSEDYDQFVSNVIANPNCLYDYYQDFIGCYNEDQLMWGRYESMCQDLITILYANGEKFDEQAIRQNENTIINPTNRISNKPNQHFSNRRSLLHKSEASFINRYYK